MVAVVVRPWPRHVLSRVVVVAVAAVGESVVVVVVEEEEEAWPRVPYSPSLQRQVVVDSEEEVVRQPLMVASVVLVRWLSWWWRWYARAVW